MTIIRANSIYRFAVMGVQWAITEPQRRLHEAFTHWISRQTHIHTHTQSQNELKKGKSVKWRHRKLNHGMPSVLIEEHLSMKASVWQTLIFTLSPACVTLLAYGQPYVVWVSACQKPKLWSWTCFCVKTMKFLHSWHWFSTLADGSLWLEKSDKDTLYISTRWLVIASSLRGLDYRSCWKSHTLLYRKHPTVTLIEWRIYVMTDLYLVS